MKVTPANWSATWQKSALPTLVKISFHHCTGAWPVPIDPQFTTLRGLWLRQTPEHCSHHSSSKKETVDKEDNGSILSVTKAGGRRGKVWSRRWSVNKEIRGRSERIHTGCRKYLVPDHRISRHVEDIRLSEQLEALLPGNCLGITCWYEVENKSFVSFVSVHSLCFCFIKLYLDPSVCLIFYPPCPALPSWEGVDKSGMWVPGIQPRSTHIFPGQVIGKFRKIVKK